MIKIDPIIAVKNIEASSLWYEKVLGCRRAHGGDEFAVLISTEGQTLLCLHQWGAHEHPTMIDPSATPGNGLILYIKTEKLNDIKQRVKDAGYPLEEDMHLNSNSGKMEFSLRDPDGYYLTITEYHNYEG